MRILKDFKIANCPLVMIQAKYFWIQFCGNFIILTDFVKGMKRLSDIISMLFLWLKHTMKQISD